MCEIRGHLLHDGPKNEVFWLGDEYVRGAYLEIVTSGPKMARSGRVGYEFDVEFDGEHESGVKKVEKSPPENFRF